jgi:hypothetical protein
MRLGKVLALILAAVAATGFAQKPLPTESASFTIAQGQKNVGKTSYSIENNGGRYTIRSHGNIDISQLNYAFSNTATVTQKLNIAAEQLSGKVNGAAATFSVTPDPARSAFRLNISANGQVTNNSVQRNAYTIFFPDFDASAYVVLLSIAEANPNAPFWALIPKQNGILSPVQFVPDADAKGTLNNQALQVKHHLLTIGSVTSDVYSGADGQLLEVDIPEQGFAIIRDGFALEAPQKAPAPPQPAPDSSPQDAPQTQPQ